MSARFCQAKLADFFHPVSPLWSRYGAKNKSIVIRLIRRSYGRADHWWYKEQRILFGGKAVNKAGKAEEGAGERPSMAQKQTTAVGYIMHSENGLEKRHAYDHIMHLHIHSVAKINLQHSWWDQLQDHSKATHGSRQRPLRHHQQW